MTNHTTELMFAEFSGSYYLGRLYVEPSTDDTARMCHAQHERVNEQLYGEQEGVERLDWPLVMKLDTHHFPVHRGESVPADTLAVPESLLEDSVRNPPTLREVLLAKADRAAQLLRLTGSEPTGGRAT